MLRCTAISEACLTFITVEHNEPVPDDAVVHIKSPIHHLKIRNLQKRLRKQCQADRTMDLTYIVHAVAAKSYEVSYLQREIIGIYAIKLHAKTALTGY